MLRPKLLMVAALLLAGCGSEAQKLEDQLEMMEKAGANSAELCAQKRKVEAAYLKAGNTEKYEAARGDRSAECAIARVNGSLGINE